MIIPFRLLAVAKESHEAGDHTAGEHTCHIQGGARIRAYQVKANSYRSNGFRIKISIHRTCMRTFAWCALLQATAFYIGDDGKTKDDQLNRSYLMGSNGTIQILVV